MATTYLGLANTASHGKSLSALYWNDALGATEMFKVGTTLHTLFTNIKWGEDEFNFLKARTQLGATGAFNAREARWAKYGF